MMMINTMRKYDANKDSYTQYNIKDLDYGINDDYDYYEDDMDF